MSDEDLKNYSRSIRRRNDSFTGGSFRFTSCKKCSIETVSDHDIFSVLFRFNRTS